MRVSSFGEARDRSSVVLLALPPEAAILPAAESTRAVRNGEALAHRIGDNGEQLPDVFAVARQDRKPLRYDFRRRDFRDRFDFRLAASGFVKRLRIRRIASAFPLAA